MTEDEINAVIERVIDFNSCCGWEHEFAREIAAVEREACAKVCDELINEETCYVWIPDAKGAVNNCAAAIRARGEK